jgi:GNAT superfamily N-acetyltransferase
MNALVLRDAQRGEVAAIVKMLADDELGRTREEIGDRLPAAYYEAYEELARDPNNRLLVAEIGGEIVGTLQLTFIRGLSRKAARRAQIEAVRVAGPRRGTGLGEQMIRLAIEIARNAGCSIVQLTTDKRRKDAHRFYERLGFVASHEGMKLSLD